MQTDQSTGFIKASACLKHYAAYSEESGRNGFAAMVTSQDMTDTYLPAFEAGVETGKASGIMCSYASRAVQFHPHGGQSDFFWLSARTPHGAYVW